ncbi:MAG: hypothetical protein ACRC17_07090 [Culicoidibacterales bacterium]
MRTIPSWNLAVDDQHYPYESATMFANTNEMGCHSSRGFYANPEH